LAAAQHEVAAAVAAAVAVAADAASEIFWVEVEEEEEGCDH
jgi:hypothetical protein